MGQHQTTEGRAGVDKVVLLKMNPCRLLGFLSRWIIGDLLFYWKEYLQYFVREAAIW